jgi:catechol 2,3-dioxygenase-like lactoylglutathione lyase family enzyme
MKLTVLETPVKFHLSLNASDLGRSVAFYRVLFGLEPAKFHDDYAKFEIEDPPVIFSLVPRAPGAGGCLSTLGLRVADAAAAACRQRLRAAGIDTTDSGKLWVRDPDGTLWRISPPGEDDGGAAPSPPTVSALGAAQSSESWEHFITQAKPDRIPHADASLDEVRLTGSFNGPLDESQRLALVREARRVLRPGGRLLVHGLMADAPFPGSHPTLPGLAAMVSRVPLQTEPAEVLRAAGFTGIQIVKFTEKPWLEHDGVGVREVKILARQPYPEEPGMRRVVYRGPFREALGDDGRTYPRGQPVDVPLSVWEQLREGPAAGQFE